jgi:hypothetical protein
MQNISKMISVILLGIISGGLLALVTFYLGLDINEIETGQHVNILARCNEKDIYLYAVTEYPMNEDIYTSCTAFVVEKDGVTQSYSTLNAAIQKFNAEIA